MGFMERFFGGAKRSDEPPPQVKEVFDKVRRLLEDEAAQNELYMPEVSKLIASGKDVDRVANGVGVLGETPGTRFPSTVH